MNTFRTKQSPVHYYASREWCCNRDKTVSGGSKLTKRISNTLVRVTDFVHSTEFRVCVGNFQRQGMTFVAIFANNKNDI